jgi:hypothetical protein
MSTLSVVLGVMEGILLCAVASPQCYGSNRFLFPIFLHRHRALLVEAEREKKIPARKSLRRFTVASAHAICCLEALNAEANFPSICSNTCGK